MRLRPTWGGALLILGSGAAAMGCGSATDLPETGDIGVRVTTTGPEPDRNGYRVQADGGPARGVAIQDSTLFDGLSPGDHSITLSDLADNCSVSGDGQRTATVTAGATSIVAFQVTCVASAALRVVTRSDGTPADPDGYLLEIFGRGIRPVGRNESITVGGFRPGLLGLELGGLDSGCRASGDARREVRLVAGDTAEVTFQVVCAPLPPPPVDGSIVVTVNTSVVNAPVPNGYRVTLDGGRFALVAASGSVTLAHVSAGLHSVELSGMPPWCGVGFGPFPGMNPVRVSVTAGKVANVSFGVVCLG